jgi:ankyrin repeat protein
MAAEEAMEAIFRAVHEGVVAEVERLLDEDDRLVEARETLTPLFIAALRGHVDVVRLLLERGADSEASDDQGLTPLHYGVLSSRDEEVVDVLLDWGADANKTGSMGATPLILALGQGKTGAAKRLLRSVGRQGLNAQADNGATAFSGACNLGHTDIARLLLLEGADHTIPQHGGCTALMAAESKGHEECVALIQVRTHMIGFVWHRGIRGETVMVRSSERLDHLFMLLSVVGRGAGAWLCGASG